MIRTYVPCTKPGKHIGSDMPYRACKSLLASNELSKRHTQSKESKAALRVPKDGDLRSDNISLGGFHLPTPFVSSSMFFSASQKHFNFLNQISNHGINQQIPSCSRTIRTTQIGQRTTSPTGTQQRSSASEGVACRTESHRRYILILRLFRSTKLTRHSSMLRRKCLRGWSRAGV